MRKLPRRSNVSRRCTCALRVFYRRVNIGECWRLSAVSVSLKNHAKGSSIMNRNIFNTLTLLGLAGSSALYVQPLQAQPSGIGPSSSANFYTGDPTCKRLISELRGMNKIAAQHVTNYQAQGKTWGGYAISTLSKSGDSFLDGVGERWYSDRVLDIPGPGSSADASGVPGIGSSKAQRFDGSRSDQLSFRINTLRGTITYDNLYGPYKMVCVSNKYAFINMGDMIETFVFAPAPTSPR